MLLLYSNRPVCDQQGRYEIVTNLLKEELKGRNHLRDLRIDGKIISKTEIICIYILCGLDLTSRDRSTDKFLRTREEYYLLGYTAMYPLKVIRRFGEIYSLHLHGWRRHVPPKRRLSLNGLHGGISQKIVLFITRAVTNLNPEF
jgi:hypothetical protein